jgi:hypothetical protein
MECRITDSRGPFGPGSLGGLLARRPAAGVRL